MSKINTLATLPDALSTLSALLDTLATTTLIDGTELVALIADELAIVERLTELVSLPDNVSPFPRSGRAPATGSCRRVVADERRRAIRGAA